MVVTVFFDPSNHGGSNVGVLHRLESGDLGPFFS